MGPVDQLSLHSMQDVLLVAGKVIKRVDKILCLGSVLETTGPYDREVKRNKCGSLFSVHPLPGQGGYPERQARIVQPKRVTK